MITECAFCGSKDIVQTTVDELHKSNGRYCLIENIPVWRCNNCGEKYYEAKVLVKIETILTEKPNIIRTIQMPVIAY